MLCCIFEKLFSFKKKKCYSFKALGLFFSVWTVFLSLFIFNIIHFKYAYICLYIWCGMYLYVFMYMCIYVYVSLPRVKDLIRNKIGHKNSEMPLFFLNSWLAYFVFTRYYRNGLFFALMLKSTYQVLHKMLSR